MNTNDDHIAYMLLVDLAAGRPALSDQMWAHLSSCEQCAHDAAWLVRIFNLMRSDTSLDAPPEVISRAKRLFRASQQTAWPRLRKRITALLSFDSLSMPLAVGVRAGAPSQRQLLFHAGAIDVDLRIARKGAAWDIMGQLLGLENGNAVEARGPHGTTTTPINALGEFVLRDVAAGRYALTLALENSDVEIPSFDIG